MYDKAQIFSKESFRVKREESIKCEFCKSRVKNSFFYLKDKNGQVKHSCVNCAEVPSKLIIYMNVLFDVASEKSYKTFFPVKYAIKHSLKLLSYRGFISSQKLSERPDDPYTSRLKSNTSLITSWIANDEDSITDLEIDRVLYFLQHTDHKFVSPLKDLIKNGYIPIESVGSVCYAISLYIKYYILDIFLDLPTIKNFSNEHYGEIGDVVEGSLEVTNVKWMTSYNSYVINLVDEYGNKFTFWNNGNMLETMAKKIVSIKGTIKAHTEYRGEKITQLNRVRIVL